jgi:hypothetical protein
MRVCKYKVVNVCEKILEDVELYDSPEEEIPSYTIDDDDNYDDGAW